MAEKEFVNAIRAYRPHEKADYAVTQPDGSKGFVVTKLTVFRDELLDFLAKRPEEKLRLDVKVDRKGNFYCEVNTWMAEQPPAPAPTNPAEKDDDLPF